MARSNSTKKITRIQREKIGIILDAALDVFSNHGFRGATIDMIADSRIPAEYVSVYLIANPMAVYLSISRTLIMGTPLGISTDYILIALIETLMIFIIGSYYYQAKQDQAVKYL